MKKIVVIGGGTGTFTVLQGLKHYPLDLSVVVSMMDSGGSNRVLRDEFGILPISDIRQCIVALSSDESDEVLRELFTYRYSQGVGISGMTFGNLFMAALSDIYGSQQEAIEKTCEMFDVKGKIIPVTYDNSHLVATYEDGSKILGEHYIDEPKEKWWKQKIVKLETIPTAYANKKAIQSIKQADLIILGPGDLYTSIICNFIIDGISEALRKTKAKKLYVMNLMTKPGQTHKFSAQDHINAIEEYIGPIDYCLVNKRFKLPLKISENYEQLQSYPVINDLNGVSKPHVILTDIISKRLYNKHKSDEIMRSFVRHDSYKLAKAIVQLLNE